MIISSKKPMEDAKFAAMLFSPTDASWRSTMLVAVRRPTEFCRLMWAIVQPITPCWLCRCDRARLYRVKITIVIYHNMSTATVPVIYRHSTQSLLSAERRALTSRGSASAYILPTADKEDCRAPLAGFGIVLERREKRDKPGP